MNDRRLAEQVRIVGSGLLGASIGLGLRAHDVDVIVEDASPSARNLAIAYGAGRARDLTKVELGQLLTLSREDTPE